MAKRDADAEKLPADKAAADKMTTGNKTSDDTELAVLQLDLEQRLAKLEKVSAEIDKSATPSVDLAQLKADFESLKEANERLKYRLEKRFTDYVSKGIAIVEGARKRVENSHGPHRWQLCLNSYRHQPEFRATTDDPRAALAEYNLRHGSNIKFVEQMPRGRNERQRAATLNYLGKEA